MATTFLAGCTVTEPGSATPGAGGTGSTSTSEQPTSASSAPSGVDIPPPPKELSLDGVDPCTLFSDSQRAQLQIDDVSPDDGSDAGTIYQGMKACTLDKSAAEPFHSYDIVAVTNVDVSFWINEDTNADAELISIDGYPAAKFHIKGGGTYDCAIALGVAKNQHLHVEMASLSDDLKGEQLCQGSEQAAEMALRTLQTLR
ncbi:DUF3558 domain-containing protein [Actinophytocola sp. KF-1]